jgi:catechol 2,3-dioxygenase-like lactoylglutathione lyase family enzyme
MWVLPVRCGRRAIHHTVVIVRDLDASLRFYRDGLGLDVLADRQVEGDWPGLPGAPSRSLRAVFLGDPGSADLPRYRRPADAARAAAGPAVSAGSDAWCPARVTVGEATGPQAAAQRILGAAPMETGDLLAELDELRGRHA